MNIQILQLLEGAKQASGLTVIIDVFRAYSVEAYAFSRGAIKIIPVESVEEAFAIKKEHPDYLLIGERGGKIIDGFDYGNSPSAICHLDLSNKTIIHTTSAGTKGMKNAMGASIKMGGSLVNARAIAKYIQQSDEKQISLVCMGLEAKRPTEEDTLCARYIKALLDGKNIDLDQEIESLKLSDGAKFLDIDNDIFPEDDFYLCTKYDQFDFVMIEKDGEIIKCEMGINK